jgi:osmotically-inducible protein OsmY
MLKTSEILRQDVMDELAWDGAADAASIGVSAADGAVTLTGHVRSYAEKRAAEKAAKRVPGVIAVANELEVRVPSSRKRDDTDIAGAVGTALKWSVSVPGGITAVVDQGWVTLDGAADMPFQRRAAENAVRGIVGVRGVTNLIRVARTRPA